MVLGSRIWKSTWGVSVFDVPLAVGGFLWTFEEKIKHVPIQFLCYGSDCSCQYGSSDGRSFPYIEQDSICMCILWRVFCVFMPELEEIRRKISFSEISVSAEYKAAGQRGVLGSVVEKRDEAV